MNKAGVIGYPIEHSLSPVIHTYWLKKLGLNGSYEKILVQPESLEEKIQELKSLGFKGFNVTVPHKEAIIPFLDEVSEQAKAIGAVNTVSFEEDGQTIGENTDKFGFWFGLQSSGNESYLSKGSALIIGAGGAARSVIANLLQKDMVYIYNRSKDRAIKIKDDFAEIFEAKNIEVIEEDKLSTAMYESNLLVNATSLGMKGGASLDLDIGDLRDGALVYDIVYNPLKTELLKHAENRGLKTLSGLDMLIGQAIPGFTRWFGENPGLINDELRKELITFLENR